MDDLIFIPIIVLGCIISMIYYFVRKKAGKAVDLKELINAFMTSAGIVGGVLVMSACMVPALMKYVSEMKLYMFIAGMAVVYVSAHSIKSDLFSGK